MPLVVPGVNSAMEQKTEWYNKLKGKKFVEEGSEALAADANVCFLFPFVNGWI